MIETSNDSLPTPEGVLALVRPGGARGLRAWDAADALLLDTAHDYLREQPDARVLADL